ncbi:GNAT family N-acetyltransferase [Mucilaginibacter ginsenosidivorans]|uniref:GNAT family N-acetyltransferase n=1 Tax=Mucilaginibacter ginsenosidivorans TaxID=398053 RepID=A0A5B8UTX0_9SPHI|nr:GNAT family N-acetyltransferase [Mucilaginibacter ginsenosidivorans]QEC61831.1 GNAT family N-acetyltransferase [Mucilaginibacter ginsenosidivorans]
MEHILDNPAWNAMASANRHLTGGNDSARYFDKAVSPFAALRENSPKNFLLLYDLLPRDTILFVTPVEMEFPCQWKVAAYIHGLQMVHDGSAIPGDIAADLVPLTRAHVPLMLELTKLTNPGPFAERTIDFGHYHGIFEGDKLVAMTGQRFHPPGYAEISAVCTHPDHTGKGYAKQLMIQQIHRIRQAGETPFLHVRYDNHRAIKVYGSLGFATRREVHFYVLKKADQSA